MFNILLAFGSIICLGFVLYIVKEEIQSGYRDWGLVAMKIFISIVALTLYVCILGAIFNEIQ